MISKPFVHSLSNEQADRICTNFNCSYTTCNQVFGSLNKQLVRNHTRVTNYKLLKVQSIPGNSNHREWVQQDQKNCDNLSGLYLLMHISYMLKHVHNEDGWHSCLSHTNQILNMDTIIFNILCFMKTHID